MHKYFWISLLAFCWWLGMSKVGDDNILSSSDIRPSSLGRFGRGSDSLSTCSATRLAANLSAFVQPILPSFSRSWSVKTRSWNEDRENRLYWWDQLHHFVCINCLSQSKSSRPSLARVSEWAYKKCFVVCWWSSGLTADNVTYFSAPITSVIWAMGFITSRNTSIAVISPSVGMRSVFLSSRRAAQSGCCCFKMRSSM